jgi:hypothetical protein
MAAVSQWGIAFHSETTLINWFGKINLEVLRKLGAQIVEVWS